MNKEKGLTIIELLVTITILVATVTTVLALGDRAVSQAGLFTAHTQATFLAKEGMEILSDSGVRKEIRDNIEDDGDWDDVGFWIVDYKDNSIEKKNTESECYRNMRINNKGFFAKGAPPESRFSRCITVWADDRDDDLKTQIDVSFDYKNNDYSVILHGIFYD